MSRRHALVLSLAIGVIAVIGLLAATRTVGLGKQARSATDAQIARRTRALDNYAASLQAMLAGQPSSSGLRAGSAAAGSTDQPVRVIYHRPPPIVIHTHRAGETDGVEGGKSDD